MSMDRLGTAHTLNRQWFVVTSDGKRLPILHGDVGHTHRLLRRGRDQYRHVLYQEHGGYAIISSFAVSIEIEESEAHG